MEVVAVSGLGLPKAGMPEEYSRLADPRREPPFWNVRTCGTALETLALRRLRQLSEGLAP